MNDYETNHFIQCVRDRPPLWDKDLEEYTNRGIREQLWADIGEIVFPDEWPHLDLKARTEKVKEIKNRWRHIRDSYIKQLRGNQPRKRKREYLHAASLRFIGDLVKRKKGNETAASDEDEATSGVDDSGAFVKLEDHEYIPPPEVTLANDDYQTVHQSSNNPSGHQGPSKSYPYNRAFSNSFKPDHLQQVEPSASSTSDQDEADKLFLLSILPDYRKLNEDEKLDFRILVLQYFRNVRQKHVGNLQAPATQQQSFIPQDVNQHFLG